MNKKLKSNWTKLDKEPASNINMFDVTGVGFLELAEAFALYHPFVLDQRFPSEMPMSVQEKFLRSGFYEDGRYGLDDEFDRAS